MPLACRRGDDMHDLVSSRSEYLQLLTTLRLTTCALTSLCGVVARIPTTLRYARMVLSAPIGASHAFGMMSWAMQVQASLSTIRCLHFILHTGLPLCLILYICKLQF